MTTLLMNPWHVGNQRDHVTVSVIELNLQRPWHVYLNYNYVRGVDTKLSRIPRHYWGLEKPREALYRAHRVVQLVDVTACIPVSPNGRDLQAYYKIPTINHCDHTTYWSGPNGERFVLTEPYHPRRAEIEAEIQQRELSAIVLPYPGLYAGGGGKTYSVLMSLPEHYAILRQIVSTMNAAGWPSMPEVQEVSWIEATQLSKAQARGACHA